MNIYYGKRDELYEKEYGKIKSTNSPLITTKDYIEGIKWIRKDIKDRGFDSPYMNISFSQEDDFVEIDFGSWSYFYCLNNLTDKDWSEFFGDSEE